MSYKSFQNRVPDRGLYQGGFVTQASWSQTYDFCAGHGYNMTTIHSFEELQTIHDWLVFQGSQGDILYIGLQLNTSQQVSTLTSSI